MYRKVDENQVMTDNEAIVKYPDSYLLVRRDKMNSYEGAVLYVGDDRDELFSFSMTLDEPNCVLEGLNLRRSLGGIVIGG